MRIMMLVLFLVFIISICRYPEVFTYLEKLDGFQGHILVKQVFPECKEKELNTKLEGKFIVIHPCFYDKVIFIFRIIFVTTCCQVDTRHGSSIMLSSFIFVNVSESSRVTLIDLSYELFFVLYVPLQNSKWF